VETINDPKDKLQKELEKMEKDPKHPLPGVQDKGEPDRLGEVPPNKDDLVSGKSGGHFESDSDLGV
jgi:hypothetical protein